MGDIFPRDPFNNELELPTGEGFGKLPWSDAEAVRFEPRISSHFRVCGRPSIGPTGQHRTLSILSRAASSVEIGKFLENHKPKYDEWMDG